MNRKFLTNRRYQLLLLCVGALAFAGCGGGDGDGSSTASTGGSQGSGQTSTEAANGEASGGAGGGSGGGETTTASGADATLIKEADAICKQAGKRYRQEVTKALSQEVKNREEEEEAYEEIVDRVIVPHIEGEIEELQGLGGSPGGEEAVDQLTTRLEGIIDAAQADPLAFSEGSVPAVAEAEKTGSEFGFSDCGPLG